jgi:CHAD domain-containing protein
MARASIVPGLLPRGDLESNARRILLGRLADMLQWMPHVLDPDDRQGLHDFRIAVKRLRYALEFLGRAQPEGFDRKRFTGAAVALQEALGAVTDCDAHRRRLLAAGEQLDEGAREGLTALVARAESERETSYAAARELVLGQLLDGVWPDLLRALVEQ